MMKILVTAGGTNESIDSVRSITNKATGRLGSIIADTFLEGGFLVDYICGEFAVLPKCMEGVRVFRIRDVTELMEIIQKLMNEESYDCVIHSMAVSDYTPQAIFSVEEMIKSICTSLEQNSDLKLQDKIRTAILSGKKIPQDKKIDSKTSEIAVILKQTPKVIRRVKLLQPNTILVGFKLLSNAAEDELIEAGYNLLEKNNCDYVLANDLRDISNDKHKAVLIDRNKVLLRAESKQEIAEVIYGCIVEKVNASKG